MTTRRFPPPWTAEEPDPKLDRQCFIVRDANGYALAYVYFEGEPGRRAAARLRLRCWRGGCASSRAMSSLNVTPAAGRTN